MTPWHRPPWRASGSPPCPGSPPVKLDAIRWYRQSSAHQLRKRNRVNRISPGPRRQVSSGRSIWPAPPATDFATCSSCGPGKKPVTDVIVSDCPAFRPDVARSVRLFRAFRTEQAAPSAYYAGLARDTIRQLGQYLDLHGQRVVDVGGGPGFFVREFREAGALALCLDTDSGELAAMGRPGPGSAVGSALRLPIASGAVDVCFSSNVLEHVGDWRAMLTEMVRVTRPGGIVFVAFTNWLSPWGGHETSPWHYLGGDRAARRYQRRHGRPPKNHYGRSLYPVSVADALAWARSARNAVLVDAIPRYLPGWTRPLLRVPVLREFLTWNLLLVLRRTE